MTHRTLVELEAALDEIRRSPKQSGTVELIVRRPAENEREVLEEGMLDLDEGLVGDAWGLGSGGRTPHPDRQLTGLCEVPRAIWRCGPALRQLARRHRTESPWGQRQSGATRLGPPRRLGDQTLNGPGCFRTPLVGRPVAV